ncbi:PepSY-associated TM helix domain-containing protein [Sphingomonas sp. AOB5]|uniref:PepSY-associated TM helix domain-containing protein n=1 Tax=Sphingomonas sp. AOB5 TaxID=3034017 RepID=UPI0023F991CB|nr:PepSY-associated TM helix domain-containing protein [Sphingomonas sp. AOB5]MDF7776913.1 PepSY-associated TM helix domain-containing protein [Sphingomonas sp. AOB5]
MKTLDLLHRWAGGLIGLVLFVMGLTGAILVHKNAWVMLPHGDDALVRDAGMLATATDRLLDGANGKASGIVYANPDFGLHQLRIGREAGAYADQAGNIVTSWQSQWQRPELWIFDLHHHLFTGDFGETIIGIAGLCAIFFIVSGVILWWRTRRTFKFRLWPARMSRPAIVMHHRDLGVVMAPLLFLAALTGTMMIFDPVKAIVIAPFSSPAEVDKAMAVPKLKGGPLNPDLDWRALLETAEKRFPGAEFRILSLPRKAGDPIALRMRQQQEWLPNGRTTLWFDAATGELLAARDALAMPMGAHVFNTAYPLHAAKVGGLAYRLVMTLTGLAMALLGSLAVWSFWFKRPRMKPRRT